MSREMKGSGIAWVGKIPATWGVERGKNILQKLDRPVKDDDGVITCFRDGEVTLRSNRREDGFTISLQEAGYQGIEPGDLVVHGMDGFAGAIGVSDSRGKATPVLNVLDSTQSKEYIMFYLRNMAYTGVFLSLATGIRVRSCDTNWNKLKTLPYIIPSIDEQGKIAYFLKSQCTEIDSVLTRTRASIEEYKKLKQAVITQAVTKGIHIGVEMASSKREWLRDYPKHWKEIRIKWLLDERKEHSLEGKEEPLSMSQKYGLIPTKNMDMVPNMAASFVGAKLAYKGDLVFNKLKAHLGVFAVSAYDGLVSPDYAVYYATGLANMKYLEYLFKTPQYIAEFKKKSTGVGAGLTRLYTAGLYSIYCALPPLEEQEEIANYLERTCAEIDTLIAKKEQYLVELENYKKSLIYEYVTGKKEVSSSGIDGEK